MLTSCIGATSSSSIDFIEVMDEGVTRPWLPLSPVDEGAAAGAIFFSDG